MAEITAVGKDGLSEGTSSPGIRRQVAFHGEGFDVVRALGQPGTASGWHHHSAHDIFGYVVSGRIRFETSGGEPVDLGPGDFFHVPPNTVHRDINPSPEEGQEVILFLRGSGPMTVNLDHPQGGTG
jgi:quercetin dioxygenase-like cupin family protein